MDDPDKRKLTSQNSFPHIEQIMKIIPMPQEDPITIYPGPKSDMINMSKADLEIAQRLERLRRSSKEIPTEDDVKSKLAKLRGHPSDYYATQSGIQHFPPEQRTQSEQAGSLISEVMDEVKLNASAPNIDDAIAARLARLRGDESAPLGFSQPSPIQSIPGGASYGFLGNEAANLNTEEIDILMQTMENEVMGAQKSLDSLNKDPSLLAAIASTKKIKKSKKSKKLKKKKDKKLVSVKDNNFTSSDEKNSNSDSELDKIKHQNVTHSKEQKEIDKIVKMYSTKATISDKKGCHSSASSESSTSTSEYMSHSSLSDSD